MPEQNDWPPEPWELKEMTWWISDAKGKRIDKWSDDEGFILPREALYRIMACVNACVDVPTETLATINNRGGFGAMLQHMFADKRIFAHLKELGFKQQWQNHKEAPDDSDTTA